MWYLCPRGRFIQPSSYSVFRCLELSITLPPTPRHPVTACRKETKRRSETPRGRAPGSQLPWSRAPCHLPRPLPNPDSAPRVRAAGLQVAGRAQLGAAASGQVGKGTAGSECPDALCAQQKREDVGCGGPAWEGRGLWGGGGRGGRSQTAAGIPAETGVLGRAWRWGWMRQASLSGQSRGWGVG